MKGNVMAKLTAVEFQHRVRQQAKQRVIKFRQEQEKRGYKNLTAFFSEPFRTELDRLQTEKGLNRQQSLDHIFDIYQRAIASNSVTSNATKTESKSTENTEFIDILQKPVLDMPENEPEKQAMDTAGNGTEPAPETENNELEFKPDTATTTGKKRDTDQAMVKGYPNRQLELEIDQQADAPPATENKSVMVKEFDKGEICKVIIELKDVQGLGYTAISRELHSMGYRPKSKNKEHFHHSTVAKYYQDGKKDLQ